MERLEEYLTGKIKGISKQKKALFLSVFLFGLFAHGYMFTNNLTYHDGILSINSLGATFNLGRFVLGFLEIAGKSTVGVFASPLFHGMLSLLFIAVSGMLVLDILHIKGILSAIYTGIVMAVFPVVTSIFTFMYTSSAYWFALFLNVLAVWAMVRRQGIKRAIISGTLLATAMGIYQAYFTVTITLFFISLMVDMFENMRIRIRDIVIRGIWYLSTMGIGLVGYLILNKIIVTIGGIGLSTYEGINEVGKIQLSKIPFMIWNAYYYMLYEIKWCGVNTTMFQRLLAWGIIFITILFLILFVLKSNGAKKNKVLLFFMMLLLPMALNSIYLMSSSENYSPHILMRYSLVFVFIIPIILLEHTKRIEAVDKGRLICRNGLSICLLLFMWLLPVTYIYLDNASYLKEQTTAWFTELIAEIKSTEGYEDDLPVVYIGEREVKDIGLAEMPYFDTISADGFGYNLEDLINNYAWRAFVERHCGYSPEEIWERERYEEMDEIKQMPSYPDKGSIQVIDNVVVVKFS